MEGSVLYFPTDSGHLEPLRMTHCCLVSASARRQPLFSGAVMSLLSRGVRLSRAYHASSLAAKAPLSKFDKGVFVEDSYDRMASNLAVVRKRLNRPLSLSEKILYGHLTDAQNQEIERGKSFLNLNPDRVAMQGASPPLPRALCPAV